MEITLDLPEKTYQNISTAAKKSKRKITDLIIDVVEEKFSLKTPNHPLANLSDEEVLALANLQIPEKQSSRHSELLYKNQAGTLSAEEKKELDFFQQIYGVALSQKADAIVEAVDRKLIKSPEDLINE